MRERLLCQMRNLIISRRTHVGRKQRCYAKYIFSLSFDIIPCNTF